MAPRMHECGVCVRTLTKHGDSNGALGHPPSKPDLPAHFPGNVTTLNSKSWEPRQCRQTGMVGQLTPKAGQPQHRSPSMPRARPWEPRRKLL